MNAHGSITRGNGRPCNTQTSTTISSSLLVCIRGFHLLGGRPPALMAVVFNRKVTKVFTSSVLNCMIGNVWVKLVTKLYHSCVA